MKRNMCFFIIYMLFQYNGIHADASPPSTLKTEYCRCKKPPKQGPPAPSEPADLKGVGGLQGPEGPQGPQGPSGSGFGDNFVFAYDTTTQNVEAPNVFQDVTFNTPAQLNAWIHAPDTAAFICNQTGKYLVTYRVEGSHTASAFNVVITVSARATLNGEEVAGSQSSLITAIPARTKGTFPITDSFILDCQAGDNLTIQFAATSTITELDSAGSGLSTTSASVTIVRVL